ncbi:hypothetical protein B0J13DRAFT_549044 [Dactylonectria estremocensis]|uniref:Uncharacterized protein n=1 Tax=Dactylonectria estremocensis TaxID=1079267 RepID=A0A9P9J6C3_9HYPO|nr:hypothetical protein B0J13DRAFT_549044 [Dactylonectria estremocensis]
MTTNFTFLNTSNAPGLGASDTKRMRAHVTKSNFAQRRRRLAKERQLAITPQTGTEAPEYTEKSVSRRFAVTTDPLTLERFLNRQKNVVHNDNGALIKFLLDDFRPLIFPNRAGCPGSPNEIQWIELVVAEPALLEASVAIGLRNCPGHQNTAYSRVADMHALKAVSMVNKRLDAPSTGLTDGVLAAVFTLALSERLINNEVAWNVHVNGLSQMMRLRRSKGVDTIPPWFSDFLMFESVNELILSPKTLPQRIIDALSFPGGVTQTDITLISHDMDLLRKEIEFYHRHPELVAILSKKIGDRIDKLQFEIGTLLEKDGPYIQAWAVAIRLFLYLSWPLKFSESISDLANSLKERLEQPGIHFCSSIDMTVWQFFVGAAAGDPGSFLRKWFTTKLQKMIIPMQVREWVAVLGVIKNGFMPDSLLLEKFQQVWVEVYR